MKNNRVLEKVNIPGWVQAIVLFILLVSPYLVKLAVECIYGVPSFDGAMNLQVTLNMVRNGSFATIYDGGAVFDSRIQTKYGVLLPIYVLWKIAGISTISALSVNAAYILLLVLLLGLIWRRLGGNPYMGCAAIGSVLMLPQFDDFAMGIYGEIPTLAIFLASVYLLMLAQERKAWNRYVLSGALFAFAFVTKTVIAIAIPSFLLVYGMGLFSAWRAERRAEGTKGIFCSKLKNGCLWAGGAVLVLVIEEIYKLSQIGSVSLYVQKLLHGAESVGKQAGVVSSDVEFIDTPNILEKFWIHLTIFCREFSFRPGAVVLLTLLICLFILWVWRFFGKHRQGYENVLVLTMFSYIGWWLLITPTAKAWARRIIPGTVLLVMVAFWVLDRGISYVAGIDGTLPRGEKAEADGRTGCRWRTAIGAIRILGICFLLGLFIGDTISDTVYFNKQEKADILEMSSVIREHYEETANQGLRVYGVGWWQAPVLSYYADLEFLDRGTEEHFWTGYGYLVEDTYALISKPEDEMGLAEYYAQINEMELIAEIGGNRLWYFSPIEE